MSIFDHVEAVFNSITRYSNVVHYNSSIFITATYCLVSKKSVPHQKISIASFYAGNHHRPIWRRMHDVMLKREPFIPDCLICGTSTAIRTKPLAHTDFNKLINVSVCVSVEGNSATIVTMLAIPWCVCVYVCVRKGGLN